MIQFLIQVHTAEECNTNNSKGNVGGTWSSKSQAMLTMGDDPSSCRRPAVHPPGTPPHSLAISIARDKAMSTL